MNWIATRHQNQLDDYMLSWRPPLETEPVVAQTQAPQPATAASGNELRPTTFNDIVGQDEIKNLLRRIVRTTLERNKPLDHLLMVGPSGTGKTTLALCVANELGRPFYQLGAPVSLDKLLELREVMPDRSILFIDEIHLQAQGDRRGRDSTLQAEQFFGPMEDRTITTPHGVLTFPEVTFIGATTDIGMLPEAFRNRFMLQPRLVAYSDADLATIARHNAKNLGLSIDAAATEIFGNAGRGTPRVINRYCKNAASLATQGHIDATLAREVVESLNRTTPDGLDDAMVSMLVFLYGKAGQTNVRGETKYVASVNTIATALGFSRDSKAISLYTEPELIRRGLIVVGGRGRELTDLGIQRARSLIEQGGHG